MSFNLCLTMAYKFTRMNPVNAYNGIIDRRSGRGPCRDHRLTIGPAHQKTSMTKTPSIRARVVTSTTRNFEPCGLITNEERDDGSCVDCLGYTDPEACNYNPVVTETTSRTRPCVDALTRTLATMMSQPWWMMALVVYARMRVLCLC